MSYQFTNLCSVQMLNKAWQIVREKGSAGGVDGMTINDFKKVKYKEIQSLSEELRTRRWKPQPYLEVEMAKKKNSNEVRKLGMTSVRDKIVQHALKCIIEPRFEKLFVGNSYAYRPNKGALKAIRRTVAECHKPNSQLALRIDIDDFFDRIDHEILQKRLAGIGIDPELTRLIMLTVKMGKIKQDTGEWVACETGVPQGAVLSPLLSNLYLHSFDQFALSLAIPYVRYADDMLFLTETREQAKEVLDKVTSYLKDKLMLSLNAPSITPLSDGFDFLGVTIKDAVVSVSEAKQKELNERIMELEFNNDGFSSKSLKTWDGLSNYYAKLLPQASLEKMDESLVKRISFLIKDNPSLFSSKTNLRFALKTFNFLSLNYNEISDHLIAEFLELYTNAKQKDRQEENTERNKKLINERKREFRKIEAEASGLLITKPGYYIGLTSRGVTIKEKGKLISYHQAENLSNIVIIGMGVSLSSNLIGFCMNKKIPVDFFDQQGTHLGSLLAPKYMESTLWAAQSLLKPEQRHALALAIIVGKIKNQHGMLKYFHKYHKKHFPHLNEKMEVMEANVENFLSFKKNCDLYAADFIKQLMGHESQTAISYWDYIKTLLTDDEVGFENREHKGAHDLFNSMLNYGYAILYAKVWQALLGAKLNPFDSFIHVRRDNKPTLVYDMVEIFRSQVVDRVAITLVQKGHELELKDQLLTDETRKLLVKSIMERLARYEKYQGVEMKMDMVIQKQASLLASSITGKTKFKPYIAKW